LFLVKSMDAETTAQCLLSVFARYGNIKRVRSDRGSQFVGEVCSSLCELVGCQQITTVGFRPEANGIVERLNAEIKRHLQGVVNARQVQNRWSKSLPLVQRILNATVQSTTGCAPAEMVFGGMVSLNRDLIVSREVSTDSSLIQSSEYVRELREMQDNIVAASQRHMATVLDKRVEAAQLEDREKKEFKEGELVLSFRHGGSKLDMKWCGPFRVVNKANANIYNCLNLRTKKMVQLDVSSLKLFKCPPHVDPVAVAGMDEGEYLVEAIVAHRLEGTKKKNRTHYYFLVKFEDGEEEWIPYWEVRELEAFDLYLRNHPDLARLLKFEVS
jgi:hypothetical protein